MAKKDEEVVIEGQETTDEIQELTGGYKEDLDVTSTIESVEHVEPPKHDLVVAVVKRRYSIMQPNGTLKTYEPGHVTMERSEADHFYAKANGTAILGIPDVGDLTGVNAQAWLQEIKDKSIALSNDIINFEVQHTGLNNEQKQAFIKAGKFVEGAKNLLSNL